MTNRPLTLTPFALTAVLALSTPIANSAPGMSDQNICQTAGYLVRQVRGKAFKTIDIPCTVAHQGSGAVQIRSGYKTPPAMGSRLLTYTAQGQVTGSRLRLNTIQVHGIDETPIPFSEF